MCSHLLRKYIAMSQARLVNSEILFKIPDTGKYEGEVVRFSSDDFLTRPLGIF